MLSGVSHSCCTETRAIDSCELTTISNAIVTETGNGNGDLYMESLGKAFLLSQICWAVVIWIVKYSILAFYWRLFSVNNRSIRVAIRALAAFVTIWGLAAVRFVPGYLRCGVDSSGRHSQIPNHGLGPCPYFSVCTYPIYLDLEYWWSILSYYQLSARYGPFGTACYHRYSASRLSSAIGLETSYA